MSPKAELVAEPTRGVLVKRVVDGLKLTKSRPGVIHPNLEAREEMRDGVQKSFVIVTRLSRFMQLLWHVRAKMQVGLIRLVAVQ